MITSNRVKLNKQFLDNLRSSIQNLENFYNNNEKKDKSLIIILQIILLYIYESIYFKKSEHSIITALFLNNKSVIKNVNYWEIIKEFFLNLKAIDIQFNKDKINESIHFLSAIQFNLIEGIEFSNINIPNKFIYSPHFKSTSNPTEIYPIINVLEDFEWESISLYGKFFGVIYENLMEQDLRKAIGSFYTPSIISDFITKKSIEYFLLDRFSLAFPNRKNLLSSHDLIKSSNFTELEFIFNLIYNIKILDPSVGVGAFYDSTVQYLLIIYDQLKNRSKILQKDLNLIITYNNKLNEILEENLFEIADVNKFKLLIESNIILRNNFYGIDNDKLSNKIIIAKIMLDLLQKSYDQNFHVVNQQFNFRYGNSLLGDLKSSELNLDNDSSLNSFHWNEEFSDIIEDGGFDIVIGNPPYIRADTNDNSIVNQRLLLNKSNLYESLYEKWDFYIPFIERGIQLLKDDGILGFIIESSFNTAKYTKNIHNLLIQTMEILELDFFPEIQIFQNTGVKNTILFVRKRNNPLNIPKRITYHKTLDDQIILPSDIQIRFGRDLFNPIKLPSNLSINLPMNDIVLLKDICYISVGMVLNADEKLYRNEFVKKDLISDKLTSTNTKPYIEGKFIKRWKIKKFKYLEWGSDRVPQKIRRKTFPEIYKAPKIIFGSITGCTLDLFGFYTNHSIINLKRWIDLRKVNNKSIQKKVKNDNRTEFENLSNQFSLNFISLILNSILGKYLILQSRRSPISVYPADLKSLPIKKVNYLVQKKVGILADYLIFLKNDKLTSENKKMFEFFDNFILNCLVFDLYFSEEYIKEGIFKFKNEFSTLVCEILQPINIAEWFIQFYGSKTAKLEPKKHEIIHNCFLTLSADEKIMKLGKRILSHKILKEIKQLVN